MRVINEMLIYRGMSGISSMPQLPTNQFMFFVVQRIVIAFVLEPNISLNDDKSVLMKKLLPSINFDDYDSIILVLSESREIGNSKFEVMLKTAQKKYEFWDIDSLQYNPSIHNLVPFHKKLSKSPADIKNLLEKYQIKDIAQLPWILDNDPMARFICAQDNDIVEIHRRSPTSGVHIVHRVCKAFGS